MRLKKEIPTNEGQNPFSNHRVLGSPSLAQRGMKGLPIMPMVLGASPQLTYSSVVNLI